MHERRALNRSRRNPPEAPYGHALYDAAGNLASRSGSSWTLGYGYDALDRLTSDTGGAGSRGYAYDANGNRLTKTVDGSPTSYTYVTGKNRLATVGGSSIGSDGLGRITSVPGYTYHYSAANRLQSVRQGSVTLASFAYDYRGLRRRKSTGYLGSNTTVYHYDEAGHLLAETNQVAGTVVLYVWADDSPVAQKSGSVLTYLHADHLQTPRWGTDAAGALVWRWKSDGFGEALPEEDVDGDTIAVRVNLRFPGQFYDAESGLHQNWMRDYQPGFGRYVEADPIGQFGGLNLYLYVGGAPTVRTDPLGLLDPYTGLGQALQPAKDLLNPGATKRALFREGFDAANDHPLSNPDPDLDNNFENRFRHCYTSCVATRRFGAIAAAIAGADHERRTGESDPLSCTSTDDSKIDRAFNEKGRELGENAKSDQDCHTGCTSQSL